MPGNQAELNRSLADAILAKEEALRMQAAQQDSDKVSIMEAYLDKTAAFRAYLLGLSGVADESLARFHIDEVFEDASQYYPWFKVVTLAPDYYKQIVDPQSPQEAFFMDSKGYVKVDELVDPSNFQKMSPYLRGYGRALEKVDHGSFSRIVGYKTVVISPGSAGGSWSGSGDNGALRRAATGPTFHTEALFERIPFSEVRDVTTMSVETVRLQDGGLYDLRYRYFFTRRTGSADRVVVRMEDTNVHIPFNAPPDTFQNIMADQIIRERTIRKRWL